ncbi:YbaN family protein [Chitinophaga sp.]|uniref:YbaN family protein n=1 Tax=Chitinophaga sp. TaxID=1869181 RepID=UPI0031DBE4F8
MRKYMYLFLGCVFLLLAYIGILLPGVPTIPFILLAGWFFMRGSDRFYQWLLRRRFMGKVLARYSHGEGVSKGMVWLVISQLWVSLIVAQGLLRPEVWVMVVINAAGLAGSMLIYRMLK